MLSHHLRLSEHRPFLVIWVLGLALRITVGLAYQPVLMFQRDTYGYLDMAATGSVSSSRPALYSILLKPAVWLGNLTVVPVVQHLMGLVVGTLIYLLLRRLGVGVWLASLGAAPVLLDAYQLDLEQYLLTETLFQALVVGSVCLLAWWVRPEVWAVVLAGAFCGLAGATRFVGVVMIIPATIYVGWARLGWVRLGALVAGFGLTFGAYTLSTGGSKDAGIAARNGFFLYGRVASFSDCDRVEVPRNLRRLCIDQPPAERGPNYGFYTLPIPIRELGSGPQANAELLDFSRRMIQGQPLDYARVVLSDLWRFAEPLSPLSKEPYVKRWMFVSSLQEADPNAFVLRFRGSPPPATGIEQTFRIDTDLARPLRTYQRFAYLWGPLVGLSILVGLIGAVAGVSAGGGRNLRATCALMSLSALALLLVPVMTTVFHFRYQIGPLPLIGPAGVLGVASMRTRFTQREGGREVHGSTQPERQLGTTSTDEAD